LNTGAVALVHEGIMAVRFKNTDRNTPLLLPPDLRDLGGRG
jgi:hypothetical protein